MIAACVADYRELAEKHQLRACWSMPIRSTKGRVLGTFANYYREPRVPTASELQATRRSAYLLSLAIESDKNERKIQRDQRALVAAGLYRQAILDSMVDGLVTVDRTGKVHTFNNAACRMMGLDAVTEQPQHLNDLLGTTLPADGQGHLELLHAAESAQGGNFEVGGLDKGGELRPISLSASKIPFSEPETFVVTLRDITQQRHDEEEIRRLAFYDPLTNLPNRRLLMDRVRQAMINSARHGRHGALMFRQACVQLVPLFGGDPLAGLRPPLPCAELGYCIDPALFLGERQDSMDHGAIPHVCAGGLAERECPVDAVCVHLVDVAVAHRAGELA